MAARKMTAPARRTPADRQADRSAASTIVGGLRQILAANRAALKALPAPAARNAAQKRDALGMRSVIVLASAQLLTLGVATAEDRDASDA